MMKFSDQNKYAPLGYDEPQLISDDELKTIKPETGVADTLAAGITLSYMDTPIQSILNMKELRDAGAAGGEIVPPEKLNELYPDLTTKFTEPKTRAVADIIAKRQYDRQELSEMVSNGPQGKLFGMLQMGAAILPHAADPLNIGAGAAVSALTAGFGGPVIAALRGTRAGAVAVDAVASARSAAPAVTSAVGHTVEGAVGNSLGEGLSVVSAKQENRDYTVKDAFYNTVGGAAFVPGMVLGFKALGAGLKYAKGFNRAAAYMNRVDPKLSEMAHETTMGRVEADKLPVADLIHENTVRELEGKTPDFARGDYTYEPLTPDRPLYAATSEPGGIAEAQTAVHDEFFGNAAYLTDDARVANGAAGRPILDQPGRVLEVSHQDLNLIDLNKPLPAEVHGEFEARGYSKADLEGKPGIEIMRDLQDKIQDGRFNVEDQARVDQLDHQISEMQRQPHTPETESAYIELINQRDELINKHAKTLDTLNSDLAAKGFDGYRHDGSNIEGVARDPRNSVAVFNREKLSDLAEHTPEVDKIPGPDPERITELQRQAQSPLSQFTHENPEAQAARVDQLIEEPPKPPKLVELEKHEREMIDGLESLDKQGLLDEGEKKVFESIKAAQSDAETIAQHLKDAAMCILMGSE